ncbi:MAG: LptE family protein [Chthoniobacteraceae bacterium]|nr:LptE family protein [Chthoniobacteraceae bacterium]
MRFPFFALLAALFLCTGCAGYHLGATVPKRMEGIKTIAIPTFRNDTMVPRLEVLCASSVVEQFQQDGTMAVRSTSDADAILEGTITRIRRRGARSVRSDVEEQQEFLLTVTVHYTITRRTTGEKIDEGNIVGNTSFFVSGNDVNQDERQAIPLALNEAAVRLVSKVTTGW